MTVCNTAELKAALAAKDEDILHLQSENQDLRSKVMELTLANNRLQLECESRRELFEKAVRRGADYLPHGKDSSYHRSDEGPVPARDNQTGSAPA